MSSRKPKQDIEYLNYWESPQLQLQEAVPNEKAPSKAPRPR